MGSPPIVTPDRRIRVFISSTMKELAPERAIVRRAVEDLHLFPVLFEIGARPHPPRELYRAYLEQSDVFVGIYWESYGWIAPEQQISGLEDEFLLSEGMPRLIYLKEPARRDERLADLIRRIGDAGISYKTFTDGDQLEDLMKDDLAVLLTERFVEPTPSEDPLTTFLPTTTNEFIGRDSEMLEVRRMIVEGGHRLITLTGPGGVGKSRLSLEIGAACQNAFTDGVHLVTLQATTDPGRIIDELASSLALTERLGIGDPLTQSIAALRNRRMLLIMDNFEHLVEGAGFISHLLEACPHLSILVTSRTVLHLRAEHEYPVAPLQAEGVGSDAVRLFEARSAAPVSTDLATVEEICKKVDGLPLAIELAAARTRLLPPKDLLRRLEDRLDILRLESPDLPERQRTMRGAISWSFDLLSDADRRFFARLSVFACGFTLESAEAVCDPDGTLDALERMQTLIENSLVQPDESELEPRFRLLGPIRTFGVEMLRASGEAEEIEKRYAEHFLELADTSCDALRSSKQPQTLDLLDSEERNIYAAFSWLVANQRGEDVVRAAWSIWPFWWMRGRLKTGESLMGAALEAEVKPPAGLSGRAKAVRGNMLLLRGEVRSAVPLLREALNDLDTTNDPLGRSFCLAALGIVASVFETPEQVLERLREAVRLLRGTHERWGLLMSLNALCWMACALDDTSEPEATFIEAVELAEELGAVADHGMALANLGGRIVLDDPRRAAHHYRAGLSMLVDSNMRNGASHLIDQIAEFAVLQERREEALVLYGFSEKLRDEAGELLIPAFQERRERFLGKIRRVVDPHRFEELLDDGGSLRFRAGVGKAYEVLDSVS
ncbi:MAG: DUF4062 domain-containing protein [Actinomycetota bacterium]